MTTIKRMERGMRLYPLDDQELVVHEGVTYRPGEDGSFGFPDELADKLHRVHHRKRPLWETREERDIRRHGEDLARRRDPETLYNAVAGIAGIADRFAAGYAPDPAASALAAENAHLRERLAALEEAQARAAAEPPEPPAKPAAKQKAAAAAE